MGEGFFSESPALFVGYLLPGLIFFTSLQRLVPVKRHAIVVSLFQYVSASALMHIPYWIIIVPAYLLSAKADPMYFLYAPISDGISFLLECMFIPVLYAVFVANSLKEDRPPLAWFFKITGLSYVNHINSAWEYKFFYSSKVVLKVFLKGGETVCGFWGEKSFASDEPNERDLYLEKLLYEKDGEFHPVHKPTSIWICGEEISRIEFTHLQESKEPKEGGVSNVKRI